MNFSYSTALIEDPYSGVARFENGKWSVIDERNGFPEGTLNAMLIDCDNQPWIGFDGRGIANWLGYDEWENWTKRQGLVVNQVWAMLRDSVGRFWAGEQQNVSILDPVSQTFHTWLPGGVEFDRVRSIAESKDGFIWIGTLAGTLFQVNVKTL